jgi:hypothetical protein
MNYHFHNLIIKIVLNINMPDFTLLWAFREGSYYLPPGSWSFACHSRINNIPPQLIYSAICEQSTKMESFVSLSSKLSSISYLWRYIFTKNIAPLWGEKIHQLLVLSVLFAVPLNVGLITMHSQLFQSTSRKGQLSFCLWCQVP